ncbi:MAG TPA: hypothetical protein VFQ51_18565 [Vicinamibacteria bacterium]|nr:hypothetical protein [Vicinamibacteria bacterium]
MSRIVPRALAIAAIAAAALACQSPTDPNATVDLIDATVAPDPATAAGPTGRFFTIEKTDEPDEVREYDWRASFSVTVRLTEDANKESVGLDLPLDITSATVTVQQASGGIVTPPTGTEKEHYDFVITSSTTNRLTGVGATATMTFDVWYDLPNLRREALVNVSVGFADDGTLRFTEVVPVKVAP